MGGKASPASSQKREGTFHVSTSRQHLAEIDAVVSSGRARTRSEAIRSAWCQAKGAKISLFAGIPQLAGVK